MTPPLWVHCATCHGEMPAHEWKWHEEWHERNGGFAVMADPVWLRPPEWTPPHTWPEAQALGWTELHWAQVEAMRALVARLPVSGM